jgi:hypothetical protein
MTEPPQKTVMFSNAYGWEISIPISEVHTKSEFVSEQHWGSVIQSLSDASACPLEMLDVVGFMPQECRKSFCKAVAVTKCLRQVWATIKRSWSRVVIQSQPCLCLTIPGVRNPSHILAAVLWDTQGHLPNAVGNAQAQASLSHYTISNPYPMLDLK